MKLTYFYSEIFKKQLMRPIAVVYGELAGVKTIVEFVLIIVGYLYILGIHPSRLALLVIMVAVSVLCVLGGNYLIKKGIPQRGNELNNDLNPELQLVRKIANKLDIK